LAPRDDPEWRRHTGKAVQEKSNPKSTLFAVPTVQLLKT
jgi:hypothetical protein